MAKKVANLLSRCKKCKKAFTELSRNSKASSCEQSVSLFSNSSSRLYWLSILSFSAEKFLQGDTFSIAPAPTEEGDAIARVEEVLADLEEQALLGAKRHSRSFSEPNLAAKVIKQQLQQAQAPPAAQEHSSEEDDTFSTYRVHSQCRLPSFMHLALKLAAVKA